jgi:hypothetical protein
VSLLEHRLGRSSSPDQPLSESIPPAVQRIDIVFLACLAAAAIALAVPLLGPTSFHLSDAWQALAVRVPFDEIPRVGVTAPGYAFSLRLWSLVAGQSNIALQIPSLIAAVLGLVAVYLLGRRLGHSRAAALAAATLLATSVNQIVFSVRPKPYVTDVVVATGLLWLGYSLLKEPTRARRWVALTGAALLALVFSASTAPVAVAALGVPALVVVAEARYRRSAAVPVICCVVYASCLGVWYFVALKSVRTGQLREVWGLTSEADATGRLEQTRSAVVEFFSLQSSHPIRLVGAALAVVVVVGAVSVARRRGIATAALLGVPIVIAIALHFSGKVPLGTGRTDLYLSPASLLLASAVIDFVADLARRLGRIAPSANVIAAVVIAMALAGAVASAPNREPNQIDGKSPSAFVRSQTGPDDRIVVAGEFAYIYALYAPDKVTAPADSLSVEGFTPVVSDPRVLLLPGGSTTPRVVADITTKVRATARELPAAGHLWLLQFTRKPASAPRPELDALQSSGCQQVSIREWFGTSATEWSCP